MTNSKNPDSDPAIDLPSHKVRARKLCHYMYASPEEDRLLKRQIRKFIGATGQTMGASEALRIMLFLSAGATDRQILAAFERAKAGDGKRLLKK